MTTQYTRIDWTKLKPQPVIGVDEAGRGCLAGPVFSSAVLFLSEGQDLVRSESPYKEKAEDYPDSKQISHDERVKLARIIKNRHIYAVGISSVEEIEKLNILQASLLSMKRAVLKCYSKWQTSSAREVHVLVDGNFLIHRLPNHFHQTTFVQGDQRLSPIASASIIAKVTRDDWISQQDLKYPQYGFSRHKGYATSQHKKALAQYGPCPLHRKGFAGVPL